MLGLGFSVGLYLKDPLSDDRLAIPLQRAGKAEDFSPLILEVVSALAGQDASALNALHSLAQEIKDGKNFSAALATLSNQARNNLQEKIGEKNLNELLSQSHEPDRRVFFHNLQNFALSLKNNSDYERAAAVFGWLTQAQIKEIPQQIRERAELEFNAIIGKGAIGRRIPVLFDQGLQESINPKVIGPMIGASLIGNVVGAFSLARLLRGGNAMISSGLEARIAAGFAGYTAEFSSFALANHALDSTPEASLRDDFYRAALSIGALKGMGFLGNQAFLKFHGLKEFGMPARLSGWLRFNQLAVPQFSMFNGMLLSHALETKLGLRPHTDDGTLVTDTISSMFNLGIGMALGHRILGPGFHHFQTELKFRADLAAQAKAGFQWNMPEGFDGLSLSLATAGGLPSGLHSPMDLVSLSEIPKDAAGSAAPKPSSSGLLNVEQAKAFAGRTFGDWAIFLMEQTQGGDPIEAATTMREGMALMQRYLSSLHASVSGELARPFAEVPLQADLFRGVLENSEYSPKSLKLFERFYREALGQSELPTIEELLNPPAAVAQPLDAPTPTVNESKAPSFHSPLAFVAPRPGNNWAQFLQEMEVTREEFDAANLPIKGATILNWGSAKNPKGRLCPPGDILHLLGVVEYLSAREEAKPIDPFEAIRLTMPEQLKEFSPDENGNIVIRYPEMMKDLDYRHFNLQSFLQLYLAARDQAQDVDLARQWGVSPTTVAQYRKGSAKMHLDTMDRLTENFLPKAASEEQKREMRNFLMFLRYRPYFEKTMDVVYNDLNQLHERSPIGSQFGIFLLPHENSLRDLDLTRRIQFEKEPIASAMDGSIDLALELLESRRQEFRLAGAGQESLSPKIEEFRKAHGEYLQVLDRQKNSPGIVQPAKIREIQNFYRDFFQYFETIHLHTRPKGELELAGTRIHFEVVPPTMEQPRGVKMEADAKDPQVLRAYAVAADLTGLAIPESAKREILRMRVLSAVLREMNVLLPGEANSEAQHRILQQAFEAMGLDRPSPETFAQFETLESQAFDWKPTAIDLSREAILHRVFRGRSKDILIEQRHFHWSEDLCGYGEREKLKEETVKALSTAFELYAQETKHPFKRFNEEAWGKALAATEAPLRAEVQEHLLAFMKSIGLPIELPKANGKLFPSPESLAQGAFAGYLEWFSRQHPLRLHQRIVVDEALIERVIGDRLIDYPELTKDRGGVKEQLLRLIDDYNQRPHPLRIHELAAETVVHEEPFIRRPLESLYQSLIEKFAQEHPGSEAQGSKRLVFVSLRHLRERLIGGGELSSREMNEALDLGIKRLKDVGESQDHLDRELALELLGRTVQEIRAGLQASERLLPIIADFVRSKNYQSGLEKGERLPQDMQAIFRLHTASALLDLRPISLEEAILQVVGERFGPYGKIREDVVRDLRVIHHEALGHLKHRYLELEEAFGEALSEAKRNKSAAGFWGDFEALASVVDGGIKDRESVEQRIADLERLLGLLHPRPNLELSEKIKKGIEEIEALRNSTESKRLLSQAAIDAVLQAEISPEILDQYPELHAVSAEAIMTELKTLETEGRTDLAKPELRSLLGLLDVLEYIKVNSNSQGKEIAESLILEAKTSPDVLSGAELQRTIFQRYDQVREKLLGSMTVDGILGILDELPEIREEVPAIGKGEKSPGGLWRFLSKRRLPPEVQSAMMRSFEAAVSGEEINTEKFVKEMGVLYWKHRNQIMASPKVELADSDALPLGLDTISPSRRERLIREFPELELTSDAEVIETARLFNSTIPENEQISMAGYETFKIRGFLTSITTPQSLLLKNVFRELQPFHQWVNFFLRHGGSNPHLHAMIREHVLANYRKHRPAVLFDLAKHLPLEKFESGFPELREMEIKPPDLSEFGIDTAQFSQWQPLAKMAEAMRGRLSSKEAREFEDQIWNFAPPDRFAGMEEVGKVINALAPRVRKFYFAHRDKATAFIGPIQKTGMEDIHRKFAAKTGQFWELQTQDKKTIRQSKETESLRLQQTTREPFSLVEITRPNGQREILDRFFDPQHAERIVRKLGNGEPVDLNGHPYAIPAGSVPRVIPIAPYLRMGGWFRSMIPDSIRKMTAMIFMEGVVVQPGTARYEISLLDLKAAILLTMGLSPEYIAEMYGTRVLEIYRGERPRLLNKIDYAKEVAELPEIQAVPPNLIEETLKRLLPPGKFTALEPMPKTNMAVIALLTQIEGEQPELANRLAGEYKKILAMVGEKRDRAAARFYLEHRAEILPHLKPWETEAPKAIPLVQAHAMEGSGQRAADILEILQIIPEVWSISDSEVRSQWNKNFAKDPSLSDPNRYPKARPLVEGFLRVDMLLRDESLASELRQGYSDLIKRKANEVFKFEENILADMKSGKRAVPYGAEEMLVDRYVTLLENAANYFLINRDQILMKAEVPKVPVSETGSKNPAIDVVHEVSNYPEMKAISPSELKKQIKKSRKTGAGRDQVNFPGFELMNRIGVLCEQPWFPKSVLKLYFDEAQANKDLVGHHSWDSKTRYMAILRRSAEIYKANREEILAAKQNAEKPKYTMTDNKDAGEKNLQDLAREILSYPELQLIDAGQLAEKRNEFQLAGIQMPGLVGETFEMFMRIIVLIKEFRVPPQVLQKLNSLTHDFLSKGEFRPQMEQELARKVAEFYRANRAEILSGKPGPARLPVALTPPRKFWEGLTPPAEANPYLEQLKGTACDFPANGSEAELLRFFQGYEFPPHLSEKIQKALWDKSPSSDGSSQTESEWLRDQGQGLRDFANANRKAFEEFLKKRPKFNPNQEIRRLRERNEKMTQGWWELSVLPEQNLGVFNMLSPAAHQLIEKYFSPSGRNLLSILSFSEMRSDAGNAFISSLRLELDHELAQGQVWALLGADPAWVAAKLENRLLKIYQNNRARFLKDWDLSEIVAQLPEIQGVSDSLCLGSVGEPQHISSKAIALIQRVPKFYDLYEKEVGIVVLRFPESERIRKTFEFYLKHRGEISSETNKLFGVKEGDSPAIMQLKISLGVRAEVPGLQIYADRIAKWVIEVDDRVAKLTPEELRLMAEFDFSELERFNKNLNLPQRELQFLSTSVYGLKIIMPRLTKAEQADYRAKIEKLSSLMGASVQSTTEKTLLDNIFERVP